MTQFIQDCFNTANVSYKYNNAWYKVKSRSSIGDMTYLYEKFNPTSEDDFYNKYIEDGFTSTETNPQHRGRSLEELNKINKRYCYLSNSTNYTEGYNNLIYHIIVETYRGHQKERELQQYVESNGWTVNKTSGAVDAEYGIDLECTHNKQKFFIQVKPISFFYGNSKWDLKKDRVLAFDKRNKARQDFKADTYFAVYRRLPDESTEWLVKDNNGILWNYESLLNSDGTAKEFTASYRRLP